MSEGAAATHGGAVNAEEAAPGEAVGGSEAGAMQAATSGNDFSSAPVARSVRTATQADLPALVALIESSYRGEVSRAGWTTEADLLGGQRIDLAMAQEMQDDPRAVFLLFDEAPATTAAPATTTGSTTTGSDTTGSDTEASTTGLPAGPSRAPASVSAPIACVQIRQEGHSAYFGTFAVSPAWQGTGLGSELMKEAQSQAVRRWGSTSMRMTVIAQRSELISYYERRGWVRTGRTEPFPYGDERFGIPRVDDLHFVELVTALQPVHPAS